MLIRLPLWHTRCVRSGLPMNKVTLWLVAIFLVGAGAIVEAQQPKKVPRIGYLSSTDPASESPRSEGIRLALRELGYIEGQNIVTEYRYTERKLDRLPELLTELVRLKVDIIVVAGGSENIRAAKNATKTIPIVMVGVGLDPVEAGSLKALPSPAVTSPVLQTSPAISAASGWSCSKKRFAKSPALRFFTRPITRATCSSSRRFSLPQRVRLG